MRKKQNPLWGLGTFVLLMVALVVSLSHGRVIESIIIGILALPSLL